MIPGARPPYASRPLAPRWIGVVLTVLIVLILGLFIVDRVFLGPADREIPVAAVIDHLNRHEVRRVSVPARQITVELTDGKTMSTSVTPDRDLWPAIRQSGADVTIVASRGGDDSGSVIGYVFQFVPFIVMAVLLIFILQQARRSAQ